MMSAAFFMRTVTIVLFVCTTASAQTHLAKSVFGAGGLNISGTGYSMRGTLGQPLTGPARSGAQVAWIGFWYDVSALPVVSVDNRDVHATGFVLEEMYPNPVSVAMNSDRVATIGYTIPFRSRVLIELFSILGEKVAILVDQEQEPGRHTCTWPTSGLTAGIYFYRLSASGFSETKKAIVHH